MSIERREPDAKQRQARIAAVIREKKDILLEAWLARPRAELPAAASEAAPALVDHMPDFLGQLADVLDPHSRETVTAPKSAEVPAIHGRKRAELSSFSLPQVLWEYSILRHVIFDTLEAKHPLAKADRDLLLDAFDRAMCRAAAAFVAKRTAKEREEKEEIAEERDRLYEAARAILGNDGAVRLRLARRPD